MAQAKNHFPDKLPDRTVHTYLNAAENGDLDAVRDFAKRFSKHIDAITAYRVQTALICAASNGHKAVVELLLQKGASVDYQDIHWNTPLIHAAWESHTDIAELLLKKNSSGIDHENIDGHTALQLAARNGDLATAKLLINYGANVNVQDGAHRSPLISAASHGHNAMVHLLLENGADITHKDFQEKTAMDSALKGNHGEIVTTLKLWIKRQTDLEKEIADYSPALKQDIPAPRRIRFGRPGL